MSTLLRRSLLYTKEGKEVYDIHFVKWISNGGEKGVHIPAYAPYIDTGIKDNTGYTYTLEFMMYPNDVSGLSVVTGCLPFGSCDRERTGANATQIYYIGLPAKNSTYHTEKYDTTVCGSWAGERKSSYEPTVVFGKLDPGTKYTLQWNIDNKFVSVNGDETVGGVFTNQRTGISTGYSCFLFAANFKGKTQEYNYSQAKYLSTCRSWQKLYKFAIQDGNGDYLVNLRPCYMFDSDANRVYGVYDSVKDKFMKSPNGIAFEGSVGLNGNDGEIG